MVESIACTRSRSLPTGMARPSLFTMSRGSGTLTVASEFSAGVHLWADDSGQTGLDVSPEVKYVSPEAIADDFSAFFSDRLDGYEELGREELELSGLPALWVDMQYEYEGDTVRGFMATVVRDRAGYLLFGYAPEADYADQEPTLRAMVNSLSLTDFEDAPLYDAWETYASDNIGNSLHRVVLGASDDDSHDYGVRSRCLRSRHDIV